MGAGKRIVFGTGARRRPRAPRRGPALLEGFDLLAHKDMWIGAVFGGDVLNSLRAQVWGTQTDLAACEGDLQAFTQSVEDFSCGALSHEQYAN